MDARVQSLRSYWEITSRIFGRRSRKNITRLDMSTAYHPQTDGQKTTDKVVLIKERLKPARDHQKSYADNRRKLLEFEKCLADANLHVPLDEIKIDKTLRFVEEPIEIMDREVKSLKRSKIPIVKVRYNSKRGPKFTWERKDHMKAKYPRLFADYGNVEDVRQLVVMWEVVNAEVVLSTFDVLQRFGFFLQMGFTLILATLDGLDVGLLGDVIGEDDCDDDG
ncbi:hypothetical protein Tco_0296664 [Tanacetum coccineum]